jgi:hypothetical protein
MYYPGGHAHPNRTAWLDCDHAVVRAGRSHHRHRCRGESALLGIHRAGHVRAPGPAAAGSDPRILHGAWFQPRGGRADRAELRIPDRVQKHLEYHRSRCAGIRSARLDRAIRRTAAGHEDPRGLGQYVDGAGRVQDGAHRIRVGPVPDAADLQSRRLQLGHVDLRLVPGTRFDLTLVWKQNGERHTARIEDMQCAPDSEHAVTPP